MQTRPRSSNLGDLATVAGILTLLVGAVVQRGTASTDHGVADDPMRRAAPAVVTITARDYAFDAPDIIKAGVTTIQLVNRGPDLHHVWLVRLDKGKTVEDFMQALKAGGPQPKWAVDVGGPNSPMPGQQSNATLMLTPGQYVIACVIPAPDGVPHIMKGMVKPLLVTPSTSQATFVPADVEITLSDYNFHLSRPLTAGKHVVRVRNTAPQSHEVALFKLEPGKTIPELLAWVEKPNGPPPAAIIGGVTGMARNTQNDISLDLTPGDYALLCFVPDAKDGKPHVAHGMMKQIRID